MECQQTGLGFKTSEGCLFGVQFATCTRIPLKFLSWYILRYRRKMKTTNTWKLCSRSRTLTCWSSKFSALSKKIPKIPPGLKKRTRYWKKSSCNWNKLFREKNESGELEWSSIAKEFFIATEEKYFRNAKQCRERWLNHLDPNKSKGKWLLEQDIVLLK